MKTGIMTRLALKIKNRKKRSFMDKMYIFNVAFVVIVVVASFVTMWMSKKLDISDMSPISVIVPSAFGELGIHTGFIVWKSKMENCRKFKDVNRLERLESEE